MLVASRMKHSSAWNSMAAARQLLLVATITNGGQPGRYIFRSTRFASNATVQGGYA
jgi:hypothetical protein